MACVATTTEHISDALFNYFMLQFSFESTCKNLVSTIPVFHLVRYLEGTPQAVLDTADKLIYNSLIMVMTGVGHKGFIDKNAIYMPDPERLPHRVCYMSYFSPRNAPAGSSNLAAEITVHPDAPL